MMPRSLAPGLPVGKPLLASMLQDLTPHQRKRLDEYGERATQVMDFMDGDDDDSWYFRLRYETPFEKKLESGELIGTGILLPADARRPRRIIPAELWAFGYKHYDKSSLIIDKKEYVKIEVFSASDLAEWNKRQSNEKMSTGTPSADLVQADITFSENGVLKIGSVAFLFKGQKQRRLIELLIQTYRSGNPGKVSNLLDDAGYSSNVDTLLKAFGKNKSWAKLEHYVVRENGYIWLQFTPE